MDAKNDEQLYRKNGERTQHAQIYINIPNRVYIEAFKTILYMHLCGFHAFHFNCFVHFKWRYMNYIIYMSRYAGACKQVKQLDTFTNYTPVGRE